MKGEYIMDVYCELTAKLAADCDCRSCSADRSVREFHDAGMPLVVLNADHSVLGMAGLTDRYEFAVASR